MGYLLGALAAGLVAASYALAGLHPFGNPRLAPDQSRAGLLEDAGMPAGAKNVLIVKCADCHSDATVWPVYSHLAPGSWLIERDVVEGRSHLNLSRWSQLSADERDSLAQRIVREARRGAMPPIQYRLIHWNAALTPADVATLALLAPQEAVGGVGTAAGSPQRGQALVERRCTGCHALDADREGPHLRGVFGRNAGSVPEFSYSDALKSSGLTWDESALDRWLRDTDAAVPNNNMGFSVPKAQDRADIIAFLKSIR